MGGSRILAAVGKELGGAAGDRFRLSGGAADGAYKVIPLNSYGGDSDENDYVEALSQYEVAQFLKYGSFHGTTSEAYCGQARGWLYIPEKKFYGTSAL